MEGKLVRSKSIGWYGFSNEFLVVLNVFHQCVV
jgi:hypothetical protein